jgi:hypothetical protein
MHIRLWHAPYNGGWIGFDRKQWRRWACGWKVGPQNSWKGGPDPVLWWCFGGFWGRILLQSWPWQKNPGARSNDKSSAQSAD